jgi:hypothetical protein
MTERLSITVCLARESAPATALQRSPYIPGEIYREVTSPAGRPGPVGDRGYSRAGRRIDVLPDLGVGLATRPDRDPGWSPWPPLGLQTPTIASTAPRATSPAQPPTSPGHGWRGCLPSQGLRSRIAPSVLATSRPASSRPYADSTRPWRATPDDLASLPADIERAGGTGWRRYHPTTPACKA